MAILSSGSPCAQFEDEDHACFMVLGLGPRADVLEPRKLRERVATDIDRMIERVKAAAAE